MIPRGWNVAARLMAVSVAAIGLGCAPEQPARVTQVSIIYKEDSRGVDFVSDTLAVLPAMTPVTVLSEELGKQFRYLHVRLADGRKGYLIWDAGVQYTDGRQG